jgi:hypothetical protein
MTRAAAKTFDVPIPDSDPDGYRWRYKNADLWIRRWLRACARKDDRIFSTTTFDVWLGQKCERGVHLPVMQATLVGLPSLPGEPFVRLLRRGAINETDGDLPVHLGAVPLLHVADEKIAVDWKPSRPLLEVAAREYRERHGLAADALDPYTQRLAGQATPRDFGWREASVGALANSMRRL